jgi:hypothetical protein
MIRRHLLFAVALICSLPGCFPPAAEEVSPEPRPKVAATPAKIKPILAALKRGDHIGALEPFLALRQGEFDHWLNGALKKGKATRQDIIRVFGPHFKNLDRPKRDQVVTLQYELGDWGHTVSLVFHFDATGTLSNWSISQAICGFCPHVFAHDGRWRLEGKLLAGCVGRQREGFDTLLLPRARICNGQLRIKFANLAPEVEYIDQVQLGCLPLSDGEELDVGQDGSPFVWRAGRQVAVELRPANPGQEEACWKLDTTAGERVVVLEAFNTSLFEMVMRRWLLQGTSEPVAGLRVQFDQGTDIEVRPVGTKFLRRIVLPVPAGAQSVRLRAPADLWFVRRLWMGTGRRVEKTIVWHFPSTARAPTPDARFLLSQADGQRLHLGPGQEAEVVFTPQPVARERGGFVLRMKGYYEFLPNP